MRATVCSSQSGTEQPTAASAASTNHAGPPPHPASLHRVLPGHIVPGILAERPTQELRQDITGVSPVTAFKDGLDKALTVPFVQDRWVDAQDGRRISGTVGPANVQKRGRKEQKFSPRAALQWIYLP